jgi:hypothetical protein
LRTIQSYDSPQLTPLFGFVFYSKVVLAPPLETPNESVFWKHVMGHLYNKQSLFKTKKKHGYKGISGVRFLNPNAETEQPIVLDMYNKVPHNNYSYNPILLA